MTAAISVGTGLAIAAGAAAVGAGVSAIASGKAAGAQERASQNATQEEQRQFDVNQANLKPFRDAGLGVLPELNSGLKPGGEFNRNFTLADFNADPGYQFRMDQGSRALQASAAARGGLLSGGTLKALDRYGQDFASNEYGTAYNRFNNDQTTRFNRLSAVAGTGQTATNTIANLGAQTAQNIGSNMIGAGNARAAGYVGQANAINSGISSLGNFYMQQQYLNRFAPSTVAPANAGGSPYVAGTPYGSGGNTGFYCDYRMKQYVEEITRDRVSQLRVYDFWYVGQDTAEEKWRGYMAQEVEQSYPDAVSTGPKGYLKVDYSKIPSERPYPLRVPSDVEWDALVEEIPRSRAFIVGPAN